MMNNCLLLRKPLAGGDAHIAYEADNIRPYTKQLKVYAIIAHYAL